MPDLALIAALVGGFVLLAVCGDFLVRGAVALGRRAGLSPLVAGIFIVGFGTSAPEMIVAVNAASSSYPNLALGNIVGSNIANILLVLAVPALIAPLHTGSWGQRPAWVAMALATAAWITILSTIGFNASVAGLFLVGLVGYSIFTLVSARTAISYGVDIGIATDEPKMPTRRAIGLTLIGIIGLPIGAHLIVEGGVGIARAFEVPEAIIGLTLLALGTSLPEIGAGIASALRQKTDVLIGNVLGSNIFNILGAGGLVAFFGQVQPAETFNNYDHWALGLSALILGAVIFLGLRIGRLAAVLLLLIYALYLFGLVNGWNIRSFVGV
ncbi:MAG: sodium:calcium antiporter [Pseudomonadota bacterium]